MQVPEQASGKTWLVLNSKATPPHGAPTGRRGCGVDGFPGFHPGLFSLAPSGSGFGGRVGFVGPPFTMHAEDGCEDFLRCRKPRSERATLSTVPCTGGQPRCKLSARSFG